jgi:hypothetical protein
MLARRMGISLLPNAVSGEFISSRFSQDPDKRPAGLEYDRAGQSSQRNFFHGKGSLPLKPRCEQKIIVAYYLWPESLASSLNKKLYLDEPVDAATTQTLNVDRLILYRQVGRNKMIARACREPAQGAVP